ncbi:MAG: hypothetical protein LBR45_00005, partial [Bacteroidales bacterium]|nr:hypothetical protein [Bacteroidales bacterium]
SNDFAGYNVYRKKGRGEYHKLTSTLLSENIFFDTVKETGTYTYVVASVDLFGNEARSFETTKELIDIFPPAIPVLQEILSDTGKIHLAWSQAHESDLLGYRIYRTVTNDKNSHYVLISSTPVKDTFFTDILPRNAKNKFCYKVVSVDSLFNMSEYSNIHCAAMPDVEPPEIPVIKHIVADSSFPLITWLANVDEDLHFYRLQRHAVDGNGISVDTSVFSIDIKSTQNNFRDVTAQAGVSYKYVLSACDKNNNMSQTSKPYVFRLTENRKPKK